MIDPISALMIFLGAPILLYLLLSYYYPLWKKALGLTKDDDTMKHQKCIDPEPEMCKVCPDNGKACNQQENKNKV